MKLKYNNLFANKLLSMRFSCEKQIHTQEREKEVLTQSTVQLYKKTMVIFKRV